MDRYVLPESCSLPCPDLQAEHQALIDILNVALHTMQSVPEPDIAMFLPLVEELHEALRMHFAHEEEIMAKHRYPDLASHSLHHTFCLAHLSRIADMLREARLRPGRPLLDELFDLILDDVIRADSGFNAFIIDADPPFG